MTLSIDFIRSVFNEYNKNIFAKDYVELPTPKFTISHTRSAFGRFRSKRFDKIGTSFVIDTSDAYIRNEHDYRMTILHEMIHEYIKFANLYDNRVHGYTFVRIMNEINKKYGTTVNVSGGHEEGTSTVKVNKVICFTNNYDGKEWVIKTTSAQVIDRVMNNTSWSNFKILLTKSPTIDAKMRSCRNGRSVHGRILTPELKEEIYKFKVA